MRIGSTQQLNSHIFPSLHPAFGLDEDWIIDRDNTHCGDNRSCIRLSGWMRIGSVAILSITPSWLRLHPAFGLDEDWIYVTLFGNRNTWLLHPAFGLDEDWIYVTLFGNRNTWCCIRLSGWMRIGSIQHGKVKL